MHFRDIDIAVRARMTQACPSLHLTLSVRRLLPKKVRVGLNRRGAYVATGALGAVRAHSMLAGAGGNVPE